MEHLIAYEFYYRDASNCAQFIGILPERRNDPKRITPSSILNWAQLLLGDGWDMERVNFVKVTIERKSGAIQVSHPKIPF